VLDMSALGPSLDSDSGDLEKLLSRLVFLGDDRIVEETYVKRRLCYKREKSDVVKGSRHD
jgi:hypothetical protein